MRDLRRRCQHQIGHGQTKANLYGHQSGCQVCNANQCTFVGMPLPHEPQQEERPGNDDKRSIAVPPIVRSDSAQRVCTGTARVEGDVDAFTDLRSKRDLHERCGDECKRRPREWPAQSPV